MAVTSPVDVFPKDPNEVLDYTMDWSRYLNGDIFASVTWTVPVGITNAGTYNSGSTATIWLSGGTSGTSYLVGCRITTTGGRTAERTWQINVGDR